MAGTSLWLRYYLALVAVIAPEMGAVVRILLEERFISARVTDYQEYVARVRYRLLPFVW